MKRRETWKRTLAWILMLTMIIGNNSVAVYAEEVVTEALQSADTLAEGAGVSVSDANSVETEDQKVSEADHDETADDMAKSAAKDEVSEAGAEIAADEMSEADKAIAETEAGNADIVQNEIAVSGTEEPEIVVEGIEEIEDAPEEIAEMTSDPVVMKSLSVPENAETLTDDADFDVELADEGDCKWYSFTPKESGTYLISLNSFYSSPVVDLYMKNDGNTLDYISSSVPEEHYGDAYDNSYLSYSFKIGNTYYFRFYSQSEYAETYTAHFRKSSALQSISLSFPDDLVLVSGIHDIGTALGTLIVTLTYENGKSSTMEGLDYDDEMYYENRDEYGTKIDYTFDYDEDVDISRTFTITVSAQEWNCSASISGTILSMKDAAAQNMVGKDGSIILSNIGAYEDGTCRKVFAGFKPSESGRYVISTSNIDVDSITVYDAENSKEVPSGSCSYSVNLEAGKTYLMVMQPEETTDRGERLDVSVRMSKKIESIQLENIKDVYDYDAFYVEFFRSLAATVNYEGATESVRSWERCWIYDDGGCCYSANTAEGDTIILSLWDGEQHIDLPDIIISDAVSGTFTLRVKVGDKVYQEKQITIDPISEDYTEIVPGQSCEVTSDAKGRACITFKPDKSGVYTFKVTDKEVSADSTYSIILYKICGNRNDYMFPNDYDDFGSETHELEQVERGLIEDESYLYRVDTGTPGSRFKVEIEEVQMETLPVGSPIEGVDRLGKWFVLRPNVTAMYGWTVPEDWWEVDWDCNDIDVAIYDSNYNLIDGSIYWNGGLFKGNTYYINIKEYNGATITMNKEDVTELCLNQKISASQDSWFSFTPTENKVYAFLVDGFTSGSSEYDLDFHLYDEQFNGIEYGYEKDDHQDLIRCEMEAGNTYLLNIYLYSEEDVSYSVTPLESKKIQSIQWESEDHQNLPSGTVNIEECIKVIYEDGLSDECRLKNDEECRVNWGYCVRANLYETDVDGKPDYAKPIETFDSSYKLGAGIYAWVVDVGFYNEDNDYDNFAELDTIEPIVMTIFVDQHTIHIFEVVTEKEATCSEPGRTVSRCKVCGYEDPSSEKTIAATGRHTGGTATCFKKAVCKVCGKEYGSLALRFIKLNADSLPMKTKQKTTKLTVSMGVGDSIASVKSSNTKILKVVLKNGKIKLTAQKKTGTAKLTIVLASGESKTIKVKVQKKAVTTKSIRGVSKKLTLEKKQKMTLKPELNPITSQDKIKYSSSNKKVVTVSKKGVVTAKKAGKAKITIRAGKKTFKCTITVK